MSNIIGSIILNPRKTSGFIVYGLFDGQELVWCDYTGKISEIFDLYKLRRIPGFDEDKDYNCIIFERCESVYEARNAINRIVKTYSPDRTPRFNINIGNKSRKIVCLETKEVFESAGALIRAKNINPNSIYPHLKGERGHGSVGGMHYAYVTSDVKTIDSCKTVTVDGKVYTVADAVKIAEDIGFRMASEDNYVPPNDYEYIAKTLLTKEEYDRFLEKGAATAMSGNSYG